MNENKIKILISTDSAGLSSGLANTTRNIFIPLLQMYPNKYEIHQLGFFHHGQATERVPWPIYPTMFKDTPNGKELEIRDKYGEYSFDQVVNKVNPDIVFAYGDLWHMAPTINSVQRNKYSLICYYTVDGTPYVGHLEKDGSTQWGKTLAKVDKIITLSKFGRDVLKKSCPEIADKDIGTLYHPLNLREFAHLDEETRKKNREKTLPKILVDTAFVAGFVGRNQFRKQNYKLWELTHYLVHGDYLWCNDCERITIKEWDHASRSSRTPGELTLYEQNYDYSHCWYCKSNNIRGGEPKRDFYMWLHVPKNDPGYNCDLHQRLWKVESNCIYTNTPPGKKVNHAELVNLISAWDVMYYPSGGEGFGNPPFEAMAAGVPIVYSNYSAHAEFCKFGGLPVRVGTYIPELNHGIQRSVVDTGDAVKQMLTLMEDRELLDSLSKSARAYCSSYSLSQLAQAWDKVITEVYSRQRPIQSHQLHAAEV